MRSWVVILFVFLSLSNSSDAEERPKSPAAQEQERITEVLKQLSDSIKQLKEQRRDDKTLLDLMTRISNTCQAPEGLAPCLPAHLRELPALVTLTSVFSGQRSRLCHEARHFKTHN